MPNTCDSRSGHRQRRGTVRKTKKQIEKENSGIASLLSLSFLKLFCSTLLRKSNQKTQPDKERRRRNLQRDPNLSSSSSKKYSMKNLYHKNNKGKVYPSPSSSAAAVVNPNRDDVFSVLNLLPTAIIALVSILSLQDREVLAYLITRSMKTTTTNPFSILDEEKKKKKMMMRCKKANSSTTTTTTHKPPIFDCGCFDCYTSYWFRWDSSPNRELIHQAIEAFEDHLTNGELFSNKKKNGKGYKTTTGRRGNEKFSLNTKTEEVQEEEMKKKNSSSSFVSVLVALPTESPLVLLEKKNISTKEPNKADDFPVDAHAPTGSEEQGQKQIDEVMSGEQKQTVEEEEEEAVQLPASINRGGLVRKVLPDVLGLFNSRLWSLWNPTV